MLSCRQAATMLGIKPRRMAEILSQGRIKGAVKVGTVWVVPNPFTFERMKPGPKPGARRNRK